MQERANARTTGNSQKIAASSETGSFSTAGLIRPLNWRRLRASCAGKTCCFPPSCRALYGGNPGRTQDSRRVTMNQCPCSPSLDLSPVDSNANRQTSTSSSIPGPVRRAIIEADRLAHKYAIQVLQVVEASTMPIHTSSVVNNNRFCLGSFSTSDPLTTKPSSATNLHGVGTAAHSTCAGGGRGRRGRLPRRGWLRGGGSHSPVAGHPGRVRHSERPALRRKRTGFPRPCRGGLYQCRSSWHR